MSAYDLAEKAKERLNLTSDYQLAEILKVSRSKISNWKSGRNNPDGVMTLKLVELAGLNAHDALILMTKTPSQQELALNTNADMLYIMLNKIMREIKRKLVNIATQKFIQSKRICLL